jgi:hypothetical protein
MMTRSAFPFQSDDLSAFASSLRKKLVDAGTLPGHLGLMNMVAQAAGYRNFQHFRVHALVQPEAEAPQPVVDPARIAQMLRHFDDQGRLLRWPARTWQQHLALWVIWSRLQPRTPMSEREISALLDRWHHFGDAAILRRTLCELKLVSRTQDGSEYLRTEQRPTVDAAALIRRVHGN